MATYSDWQQRQLDIKSGEEMDRKKKRQLVSREIPTTNEIKAFMHCKRCLSEMPDGTSPREWAKLEVGWTDLGLQVWCMRHDINVMHVDFEGQTHPANLGAPSLKN